MAQLRDLLVNGQSRYLGPAMFNDAVKFEDLLQFLSDARVEGNVLPSASGTYSLGSDTLKWKNIYANIFYGALSGTVTGNVTGNASTATKLAAPVKINGTDFDGSEDITTTKWGTTRKISISSTAGTTGTNIDGSANKSLVVPSTMTGFVSITSTNFVGSLTGTASSAIKATQDGDGNVITATYAPKNHASTENIYGLGSDTNYGHVKLSDAVNSTSGVSGGIAATPVAVKAAYDLAASKISTNTSSIELNQTGALAKFGGFIDFHYHNEEKKPLNASGEIVEKTPNYTSRIIEDSAAQLNINGVKFKNSVVTGAFNGTLTGNVVGNAQTATALTTDAGSSTLPVYFKDGKPVAISDIAVSRSNTNGTYVKVTNSNGSVGIYTATTRGLYDWTKSQWIINTTTAGDHTYIPLWKNKGSATKPVYFNSSGEPVAITSYEGTASSAIKATQDGDGNVITTKYVTVDTTQTVSGAKTFTGVATFKASPVLKHNGSRYGYIYVQNNAGTQVGFIRSDCGNATNITTHQWRFSSVSANATNDTGHTGFYEHYTLPASTDGLTEDKSYSILTTKSKVTVAQGGTGNTSMTANRLVWTESASKMTAGYHYASSTQVGINYTSAPSSTYTFAVSGNSYFSGQAVVTKTLTVNSNIVGDTIANIKSGIGISSTDGTGAGISLYNGVSANTAPTYGLMFAKTGSFGTHGTVTNDWATYFTMSDTNGRGWVFRRGNSNIASIGTDGAGTFTGLGNGTTYIQHPIGGEYTGAATETGFLTITLPVKFTSTMLKFKVSIYSYEDNTSVDYIIGGYNYGSDTTWYSPTATCIGKKGTKHSNHPVTFGKNADGYAQIQIGSTGTVWKYPNINISDVTLGHQRTYSNWQKSWTISFTTTQQTASKTVTNTYMGYNSQHSDFATKADYLQITSTSKRDTGLYYYQGQPTIGTAEGNAYEGSSGTLALWSYPKGGAYVNGTTVNVQVLRAMWSSAYWSEIFFSPNYEDVWLRSVQNGSAKAWRKILTDAHISGYISGTANKIAKFTAANTVGNSNLTDDGTTITLGTKTLIRGSTGSFSEGLRIIPASNGWADIFLSGTDSTSGSHEGGWLIGRRGAAGTYGAIGDLTIEDKSSSGLGLTLHKNNGGATLYGGFKVIGRILAQSAGGQQITGKTIANAVYGVSTKQTSNYHPILAVTTSSSNVWNIGGISDNVGIYGYYSARTANGTDFSTVWNTSTGALTHSGNFTVNGSVVSLANMVKITYNESVTSGTTAAARNALCIYGPAYGNDAKYIKTSGQMSYGDPGPQIVFGTDSNLTKSQKIAIIYTDNDTIGTGNSLSLVSTEANAHFIAPTIKAIKGFVGTLTGNVVGHATTAGALATNSGGTVTKLAVGGTTTPVYFTNGVPTACAITASKNRWGVLTPVGGDGVLEIGKYIDFHASDASEVDYSYRLTITGPTTSSDTTAKTLTGSGAIIATTHLNAGTVITAGQSITAGTSITAGSYLAATTSLSVGTSATIGGLLTVGSYATIASYLTVGSYISMTNSNPYVKFVDTAYSNATYYIQGYEGKLAFGPTFGKAAQLDLNGNLTLNASATLTPRTTNTGSVGTSSYKWNAMYATTFYGALSGNATTASSLATARTITLGGDLQGSVSFKGDQNVTLTATNYQASISSGNKNNYPYHRIATVAGISGTYTDKDAILEIRHDFNGGGYGRLKLSLRTNASGAAVNVSATWLYRYKIDEDAVTIGHWGTTGELVYADVYYKTPSTYARAEVIQVVGDRDWTLVASNEVSDTTATDAKTSSECYATVAAGATALRGKAYTKTTTSTDAISVTVSNKCLTINHTGA